MKRYVEAEDRSQSTLFLKRLDDYIAEDNPVREVCFHPIRTEPPKSPPETGASPSDQDLAQPSVLGRAAWQADRMELADTEDAVVGLRTHPEK
jgi:hypothetical protein